MSHVLIVEDEERIAAFLDKGLCANGFTTVVASTGEQALAQLCVDTFDVVILDIGLPGIDGYEVLRELRSWDPAIQVVMPTARDEVDTRARARGGRRLRHEALRFRGAARSHPRPAAARRRHGGRAHRAGVHARRDVLQPSRTGADPGAAAEPCVGFDYDPGSNVVDVYVGYLRKKLGNDRIATVRGMGYRFDPSPA